MRLKTVKFVRLLAAILFILFVQGAFTFYRTFSLVWSQTAWMEHGVFPGDIASSETAANGTIPKILHQTWKNKNVPLKWKSTHDSCVKHHTPENGWSVVLWTDQAARAFMKKFYPSSLPFYDSYPYPIQRVDAFRYFLLYHYGGAYMDLDIGCKKSLDPLTQVNSKSGHVAIIPKTEPIGFSNDFMMTSKGHPLFKQLIDALPSWNHYFPGPYATVFFSTGPMFLNIQAALFTSNNRANGTTAEMRVLSPDLYGGTSEAFFRHVTGNSWHSWDAALIFYIWKKGHLLLLGWIGLSALLVVLRRSNRRKTVAADQISVKHA